MCLHQRIYYINIVGDVAWVSLAPVREGNVCLGCVSGR